jgi:hypothetical protein
VLAEGVLLEPSPSQAVVVTTKPKNKLTKAKADCILLYAMKLLQNYYRFIARDLGYKEQPKS